jgi:glycerol-3-phosphate dehydrogenase
MQFPMNRTENLNRLKTETFDICIIGAGASGTGCALDASLRGLKVALIEKTDFAAETSSKSTKLIHGGVRYLEQAFKNFDFAQLKQVKHGLAERHTVLSNAPHLARPLGLITPVFTWIEGLYFTIGLKMYGFFASKNDILPKSQWLSKKDVLRRMPTLNPKMHSAILYYDGQLDDARYCLAIAQSASEAGAALANHVEVKNFLRDNHGKLTALQAQDTLTGDTFEVKSTLFINCTGPQADHIRIAANPALTKRIIASKGVHIVLPYETLNSEDAMLIPKTPDGRVVFAIPFEGQLLLGTTDDPYPNPDIEPTVNAKEVDFLLETLTPYLAEKPDKSLVKSGFGGLRPLLTSVEKTDTKTLVRDHEVEHDKISNLVSLLGGKWTTYRIMAMDTVDYACQLLGKKVKSTTATHKLAGGENYNFEDWKRIKDTFKWEDATCKHLMHKYGSRALQVAQLTIGNKDLALKLEPKYPFIRAEIEYAVRMEMVCTIRDFLARRIRLEILDWKKAADIAPIVAFHIGEILGWSEEKKQQEVEEYVGMLNDFLKNIEG